MHILIHQDDLEKLKCGIFKDSILKSFDPAFDPERTLFELHSSRHMLLDETTRESIASFIEKIRPVLS